MSAARDNILSRVRQALGRNVADGASLALAEDYIAARTAGPRPRALDDLVAGFMQRVVDMASTVEKVEDRREIPMCIARYLDALVLPPELAAQKSHQGVCWPEFATLDWTGAGLAIVACPTTGDDRLGITGVFCALAETGTLVLTAGANAPTATALLPDTHVAIVSAARIVRGMEEAFSLLRTEHGMLPRAVNFISGPSRTGDIEQTIVLGAHGPYRVHIIVVP